MGSRLELHTLLTNLGVTAYFQPPLGVDMTYPCIVYRLDDIDTKFANNVPYSLRKRYMLTVIDYDPDTTVPDQVAALPSVSFDRFYTTNNLNHYVFRIYF
jgi:hypothetical protein